ncbi:effector-associated constant component EACC1 [Micromonospora haikouensis]|uniref:effector-associated constant component EACC1 n=1 Tax=Micromonospora haikouensis TaxID=686309 RepID=UPI003D73EEAF
MGNATVEVSGAQAARWAAELRAALAEAVGPAGSVSPVQVQRSAEMVIAVIGLMFSGVEVAKTITEWWSARRREGAAVTVLLPDGTRIELTEGSQARLEIAMRQDDTGQH